MQGLLVSPYGIPELRCTPRMGSIEIDTAPVGGTYLFTYTPFDGEPLYLASSVDLFTFEMPTEEGSTELRVCPKLLMIDPTLPIASPPPKFQIPVNGHTFSAAIAPRRSN